MYWQISIKVSLCPVYTIVQPYNSKIYGAIKQPGHHIHFILKDCFSLQYMYNV